MQISRTSALAAAAALAVLPALASVASAATDAPGQSKDGHFQFAVIGDVPYGDAQLWAEGAVPCVALAGKVLIGSREMRTLGIEAAYSVVDRVGEERAFAEPAAALSELAERVARTWSR